MHQTPEVVSQCLIDLLEQPYLRQGFRGSELRISELADYGEVVGSMLIAAVVGDIVPGQEIQHQLLERARHLVHLAGSVDDTTSNKLLERIFGSAFTTCINAQKNIMQGVQRGYDFSVPREVTDEDISQAVAIDAAIVARGRAYLASDEAQTMIWGQSLGEKGGCPIRHVRRSGESDFDRFVSAQLEGYAQSGTYLGPAQFILRTVQAIKPDVRLYIVANKGNIIDWNLSVVAA